MGRTEGTTTHLELVDFSLESANLFVAFLESPFEFERLRLVEIETRLSLLQFRFEFGHQVAQVLVVFRYVFAGGRIGRCRTAVHSGRVLLLLLLLLVSARRRVVLRRRGRCCRCRSSRCSGGFLLARLIALKWRKGTDTAIVGRRRGGGRGRARQARRPVAHNSDTGDRRREIGLVSFVLIVKGVVGRNESGRVTGRPFGRSLTDSHPSARSRSCSTTAPATTAALQDLRQTDRSWADGFTTSTSGSNTAAADTTANAKANQRRRRRLIVVVRRIRLRRCYSLPFKAFQETVRVAFALFFFVATTMTLFR